MSISLHPIHRTVWLSMLLMLSCSSVSSTDSNLIIESQDFAPGQRLTELQTGDLRELSGMAASRNNPGLVWGHNDSGDKARLFLFDPATGEIKHEVHLQGVPHVDFEDMTSMIISTTSYLVIGDIGDNRAKRNRVSLYRFKEPTFSGDQPRQDIQAKNIETMHIRYAEGPRDAETLMTTPEGNLIIITKRENQNYIYRFEFEANQEKTLVAAGRITIKNITAGDMREDGAIALRNYDQIYYWPEDSTNTIERLQHGPQRRLQTLNEPQGEALAWDATGGLYSVPEKVFTFDQMIHYYPGLRNKMSQ